MEILIRCHFLWRLIRVCTVCLCPTKRTLGLNGLMEKKQTLQTQIRHRFLAVYLQNVVFKFRKKKKNTNVIPNTPKNVNGLVLLVMVNKFIPRKHVKRVVRIHCYCIYEYIASHRKANTFVIDIFQLHITLRFVRQRRLTLDPI